MADSVPAPPDRDQAYHRALDLLRQCASPHGFVASPGSGANYQRVWARDSGVMGLAALMSGDDELVETLRRSLVTLAENQGPHGEIPSNVDAETGRVSYGGTAGRVDADLWFVIACGQYGRISGDGGFLEWVVPVLERVRFLLGAWEFNSRGLLYVPMTGDWADEYLHHGYVLHDQLLYLQAQRELAAIHQAVHGGGDHRLQERIARLKHLIRDNYWFPGEDGQIPDDVYHRVIYDKAMQAADRCGGRYWLPFFTPGGYGYRFDCLANVLASLLDVADDPQREEVDAYVGGQVQDPQTALVPAFHPVITPEDRDWEELKMTFSFSFKNAPYEYHNGGLWPMVNGFYAADLARRGRSEAAGRCLDGVNAANALPGEGGDWSFPEFVHGRDHTPGGQTRLGWSAAGTVIAHRALEGAAVFGQGAIS
ncbi:MAG TPA: glycoside hydrolase 100 family protein [Gammaproteobacteria bacterium]|nr:glycoside hydrolase 100 family protein [Gammaproteobacteria bacterium]